MFEDYDYIEGERLPRYQAALIIIAAAAICWGVMVGIVWGLLSHLP